MARFALRVCKSAAKAVRGPIRLTVHLSIPSVWQYLSSRMLRARGATATAAHFRIPGSQFRGLPAPAPAGMVVSDRTIKEYP
jgi:hypothetical protein